MWNFKSLQKPLKASSLLCSFPSGAKAQSEIKGTVRTALLMGAMALLGLGYSSNAYAAGDAQNVQQATKKITGTVVDARVPLSVPA